MDTVQLHVTFVITTFTKNTTRRLRSCYLFSFVLSSIYLRYSLKARPHEMLDTETLLPVLEGAVAEFAARLPFYSRAHSL